MFQSCIKGSDIWAIYFAFSTWCLLKKALWVTSLSCCTLSLEPEKVFVPESLLYFLVQKPVFELRAEELPGRVVGHRATMCPFLGLQQPLKLPV